jgi:hypothetical protein
MKIIALRTMFLSGKAIKQSGKSQEVSEVDGDLAVRMGWATLPDDGKKTTQEDALEDNAED